MSGHFGRKILFLSAILLSASRALPAQVAPLATFEGISVAVADPTDASRLTDAGVVSVENAGGFVVTLAGELRGRAERDGAIGVLMVPELPFFSIQTYEQTMPFYLNRTMTLVDFYDEMSLGLQIEPEKGIQSMAEFRQRWRALEAGYATMKPEVFGELAADSVPMRELGRDTRRVIVSRR